MTEEANSGAKANQELFKLDLISLVRRYLRNWYWFILTLPLAILLAWWNLERQTTLYQISSKILIDQNESGGLDGQNFISPLVTTASGGSIADEIEIIKSRQVMSEVVQKLDLEKSFYQEKRFGIKEVYDRLPYTVTTKGPLDDFYGKGIDIVPYSSEGFDFIIDKKDTIRSPFNSALKFGETQFLLTNPDNSIESLQIRIDHPLYAGLRYISNLSVDQEKRGYQVLRLSLTDPFPNRATSILNELVEVYNSYVLANNKRSANTTIDFIDERLKLITQELFDVEKEVEDYKRNIEVPIDVAQSTSDILTEFRENDRLIGEIDLTRTLLTDIKGKLETDFGTYEYLPVSLNFGLTNFNTNLIDAYNKLVNERSRLLISATLENPQVQILDKELDKAKKNVLTWIQIKEDELDTREKFLQEQINPLEDKIDEVPRYERELLQIMRQQKIKETLFTYLLERREETAISLAAEVTNTRIVDYPITDKLVSPNKNRQYLIYFILGLMAPAGFFLLIELLDNTIKTESDLKRLSNAPFLGAVAKSKKTGILAKQSDSKSITSEMLRLIRTNLSFLMDTNKSNVLLVTSSQSGEGKSFITLNLANTFAQLGKKVLVVELDLRKPRIREYLGVQKTEDVQGISGYLANGKTDISSIVFPVKEVDNLFYVGSGPIPPNPSELIMKDRMMSFLEKAKEEFEIVLLDTPPVGLVTDALLLKDRVDASVFITRASYTKKMDMQLFQELYEEDRLPNLGLVLNGVKIGQGYGYGRSYGYGSYYDEKQDNFLNRFFKRLGRK